MFQWREEHRAFAVEQYFLLGKSMVKTRRAFRSHFKITNPKKLPSPQLIYAWIRKLEHHGTVNNISPTGRKCSKFTPQNIDVVRAEIENNPRTSIRRIFASSGIKRTTVHKILIHLNLHPYKIQIVPKIKKEDYVLRKKYAEQMLILLESPGGIDDIFFSDEAHFHLGGYVNKQNMRYWSEENPRELHEKKMHVEKVIVWCAISSKKLLVHIFMDRKKLLQVPVTVECFKNILYLN